MEQTKHEIRTTETTKRIHCSEIWGGVRNINNDIATRPVTTSLFTSAADGTKGGDIHYFSVCDRDTIARIALADVLGHGDAVSRMSQWIYDALAARMNSVDTNDILADLNRLANDFGHKAFTTAVVLSFQGDTSTLYFSYAGHPPVWIRRHTDGIWRRLVEKPQTEFTNLPLGMFPESTYDQKQLPLSSGDRLFLYTDGLTDAFGAGGEQFGEDRLQAVLDASGGESLFELKERVLAALRLHTGGTLGHDDVTLMAVEVN